MPSNVHPQHERLRNQAPENQNPTINGAERCEAHLAHVEVTSAARPIPPAKDRSGESRRDEQGGL